MAPVTRTNGNARRPFGRKLVVRGLALALGAMSFGANEISLDQLVSRQGQDLTPLYEGREVTVQGQITERFLYLGDPVIPIRDEAGSTLLLTGPELRFSGVQSGDHVTASGTIQRLHGMPVLLTAEIHRDRRDKVPDPIRLRLGDVPSLGNVGAVVTTEATVEQVGDSGSGEFLSLRDGRDVVMAVLAKERHTDDPKWDRLHSGDRIRLKGLVIQNCPLPPYDSGLQVLVNGPEDVLVVETAATLPASLLVTALSAGALLLAIWWIREARQANFRRTMRRLNALGEEILGAGSPTEILKKIESVVPEVVSASGVQVFLHNRKSQTLEPVRSGGTEGQAILIETPIGPMNAGVVTCFRNRTLINVPDTWRSQLFQSDSRSELPRSVMFVPMFAQSELLGVMRLHRNDSVRYFGQEEQAAAQHLANQTAAALKMQEQRSIREQLFKSEKLAATGQLISGVVNELKAPVENLLIRSQTLAHRGTAPDPAELDVLAAEARRTAEIVTRLISFGRSSEAVEAKPVELNELLGGLFEFRGREWEANQVLLRDQRSREPVYAMGVQGQLEQVFLNLLIHAEQNLGQGTDSTITVTTSAIGRRVVVGIAYSSLSEEHDPLGPSSDGSEENDASIGLGVSRGIIQNHGGDVRFDHPHPRECRFEVELPRAEVAVQRAGAAGGSRSARMTAVVLETDVPARRQVVHLLGARGHRVIPASSADEALDLVSRLACDLVLCSSRGPGLNWVEFYRKMRERGVAFVLLTDGYDAELARAFANSEGFLWPKPFDDAGADRLLEQLAERAENPATA